jgi:CubicO group peptidase (beta-lactamase class C family)
MEFVMQAMARLGVVLLCGAIVLFCCAGAPRRALTGGHGDYTRTQQDITRVIEQAMQKNGVTGLSIALVDDQQVVWTQGFGYADELHSTPATPETVYRVGSMSELFTATAAMQLAEQGKIDIDRPLQMYLPEFSVKTRFTDSTPITLRHLMSHHAGLPPNFLKGMWSTTPAPFTTVVDLLQNEYTAYPPHVVWSFSNLGVTLVGHVIEKISGEAFATHLEKAVLRPLGMRQAAFSAHPDRPLMAKAYRNGVERAETSVRDLPALGLHASVLDMSRFIRMVFANGRSGDQQVLQPATLAEMLRPQNEAVVLDQGFHVGLGWLLSGLGNFNIQAAGAVAHHAGATLCFRSQLIILPAHKLGVVVLSNSSSAHKVVKTVATEALTHALAEKTGITQPEQKIPADSPNGLLPTTLHAYEGHYATALGLVTIKNKSGSLRAEALHRTFRLIPRVDGQLRVQYKLLGLLPISLGDLNRIGLSHATLGGREILIARSSTQTLFIGEKISPTPVSDVWQQRVGAYVMVNRDNDTVAFDDVQLRYHEGFLVVDYTVPLFTDSTLSLVLKPISDTEAVTRGLGRGMGETLRVITVNGKENLQYSGYLLQRQAK